MRVAGAQVTTVVLTHNRKQLLSEALDAVLGQSVAPAHVHVVDNASSDGTEEMLAARSGIEVHRLPSNRGGAGGFAHGVEVARQDEADWLWMMDDDAEPEPDCLERMLASPAAADPSTVALCSTVRGRDGEIQAMHRGDFRGRPVPLPEDAYSREHADVGYATFVGLLVRMDAARALDPPKAEFFIWADDFEYSYRLRERGAIRLVPSSVIRHKDVAPTFTTRRAAFFNRALGWELYATPYRTAWRNYFGIRNYVWMKRNHEGLTPFGLIGVLGQFVAKALMYDEKPFHRIPQLTRYALDGWRGRFVNPPPP